MSCSRNHSRSWANDSGDSPSRGNARSGGAAGSPPVRADSTNRASAATVGASNSSRSATSTWKASRSREETFVASSECPPRAKKLSSLPTVSTFRTSDQIAATISSAGVRGAEKAVPVSRLAAVPMAGRARRSTLPLGLRGRASSATKNAGIMWSGRVVARWARRSAGDTVASAAPTR